MLLQTILHKALAHPKDFQHRFRGIPEFMSRTFSVRRKITGIPALTLSVLTILSASCSDLTFYTESGSQPDKSAIDAAPVIYLRAEQTPEDKVNITMDYGEGSATVDIYAVSDKPLDFSQPLRLAFGSEKFVADYSDSTGIEYTLLPAAFYSFADGNSLEIGTGETSAAKNTLTVWSKTLFGAELEKGRYLLPLEATSTLYEVRDSLVLIDVTIREQYTDPDGYELWDKLFTVFYLNTAVFDPRLANDMVAEYGWRGYVDGVYTSYTENYAMGHIVNLRSSMLSYDEATGRVGIEPSTDMRYVLNHYDKYVRPVQDSGRKVLLCITGGGKGVGFCNLTDIQIDQFVPGVPDRLDPLHVKRAVPDRELVFGGEVLFLNLAPLVENTVPAAGVAQAETPLAHQNHRMVAAGDIVLPGNDPDTVGTPPDRDGIRWRRVIDLIQNAAVEFQPQAQVFGGPRFPRQMFFQHRRNSAGPPQETETLFTRIPILFQSHMFLLRVK